MSKKNKRLLSLFLASVMTVSTGSALAVAANEPRTSAIRLQENGVLASGKCGENATWTFYEDGKLYISGTGAMYDYEGNRGKIPWWEEGICGKNPQEKIREIYVDHGITHIGDRAFSHCQWNGEMVTVTLSSGLQSIGSYAFEGAYIKNLDIPSGVTSIGDYAFYWCQFLENVNLPNGVTSIGESAFESCKSLERIALPNSVKELGDSVFVGTALKTLKFPSSLKSIPRYACNYTPLTKVSIPSSVKSIQNGAFTCTKISRLSLPKNLKTIEKDAFFGCDKLKSVTFPSGLTTIQEDAFGECPRLKSVTLPRSVKNIGKYALGFKSKEDVNHVEEEVNEEVYEYRKTPGFTIYGKRGSAAQKYANKYKLKFVVR